MGRPRVTQGGEPGFGPVDPWMEPRFRCLAPGALGGSALGRGSDESNQKQNYHPQCQTTFFTPRMPSFVHRQGRLVPADEAFLAWTSGDLPRMLAALEVPTNPIDRHHLLQSIVALTYRSRKDSSSRRLCKDIGRRHIREFPSLAPHLVAELGIMPRVLTFACLATILGEDGEIEEAVQVCSQAQMLGLHDGTKGDYAGRITRLLKKRAPSSSRDG
jgi:hypothetical protein